MKGYFDNRLVQDLSLMTECDHQITYTYDEQSRIIKEEVTGGIERVTNYTYDESDNIGEMVITTDGKTITKTYAYDEHNNIIGVSVVNK